MVGARGAVVWACLRRCADGVPGKGRSGGGREKKECWMEEGMCEGGREGYSAACRRRLPSPCAHLRSRRPPTRSCRSGSLAPPCPPTTRPPPAAARRPSPPRRPPGRPCPSQRRLTQNWSRERASRDGRRIAAGYCSVTAEALAAPRPGCLPRPGAGGRVWAGVWAVLGYLG